MTALAERAHGWVASVHPHLRHLERTRDWLVSSTRARRRRFRSPP